MIQHVDSLRSVIKYIVYTFCILYKPKYAMPKEKIINFRIDGQLKKQAKKLADADGRSLSNWLTRLIEREVTRANKKD